MKKLVMRFSVLVIAALLFQFSTVPFLNASADSKEVNPSWTTPIDYLALGDSLAAGMDSNGGMGKGYSDYLAESIEGTGFLKSYSKAFAYPGYTAVKVLQDLKDNVTRTIDGTPIKLQEAIAQAEFITISAGANDVLALITFDPATGAPIYDNLALSTAIKQVGITNMELIAGIHKINPNVQVYIMGYYNPFPHLPATVQPQLKVLIDGLNLSLSKAADNANVEFIATKDVIAEDFGAYVPNPANIHLSEAGYKKVTEKFWDKMQIAYPWIPINSLLADLTAINSVGLTWKSANGEVASYEIYKGEEMIATVAGDVHTYNVNNVEAGKDYVFSIVAVDATGKKSVRHPAVKISTQNTPPMFTDITTHWGKHEIELAAKAQFFSGYKDGTFRPDNELTRAQAASVLVRALGLKTDQVAPFTDIEGYATQTQADINAAYKFGLVKGVGKEFMPSNKVTRAQLALMVERAYSLKTGTKYTASSKAPFIDFGNYDAETVNAISMLYELNIATGFDGKFMPSNPTTRAHAAKILVNLLGSEKKFE